MQFVKVMYGENYTYYEERYYPEEEEEFPTVSILFFLLSYKLKTFYSDHFKLMKSG